ncbi:MAG TPA: ATP-dependent zinc metalloprotease FtsH [Steroidobacteraceae bacterium]|nr:ATP-dependent zinc metalloprotease FtsH [Steroidobacteraceae bacterium]
MSIGTPSPGHPSGSDPKRSEGPERPDRSDRPERDPRPTPGQDPNPSRASLWSAAVVVLALLALVPLLLSFSNTENLSYGDFKHLLAAGKLSDLTLGSSTIEGTVAAAGLEPLLSAQALQTLEAQGSAPSAAPSPLLTRGVAPAHGPAVAPSSYHFVTTRTQDPQLIAQLDAAHVSYRALPDSRALSSMLGWLLPMLVFVGLWVWMLRRGLGGTGGLGALSQTSRSHAKVFIQKDTGVHFSDVEGIDEAKEELVEVVRFLKDPERYRRLGGHIPKGVLIVGAPGTGKTLLAKAVAGEAGVPFLSISGSEFVEMFVGVGAARVRDLFQQAAQLAPCIIFVDELDALGKARGIGGPASNDEREQTLNQLLVELDGFDTNSGVIVLAATNRPEILDPALLRPGRLDRHVAIDRPDIRGRERILRLHARHLVLGQDVDLAELAARTPGFAGADLANIVNEAALHAARSDKAAVGMADFAAAIDRQIGGLEKRNRVMNPREKQTVAYHEAGHALIAELRPQADRVSKISIIPRGIGTLGYTQQRPTEDRYLLKRTELLDRLDVLLGGRVAEELIFGDVSTGAQDDLRKASDMARSMITEYGMSERLGEITFETGPRSAYLDTGADRGRLGCSERTGRLIDEEVAQLIAEAHRRDMQTLRERRVTLEAIAHYLLQHEVIERDELLKLLATSAATHAAA